MHIILKNGKVEEYFYKLKIVHFRLQIVNF